MVRADRVEVAAVGLHDRAQHGVVGREARHAHALALQVARPADARAGDHRGQRALHDRADPHHVLAALAREAEVVDVHDRGVGAARQQELERIGGGGRRSHVQLQPVVAVEALADGREHARMHGVGLEVERQRDRTRLVARVVGVAVAATGQRQQRESEKECAPHARNLWNQSQSGGQDVQQRGPAAYIAEFIGTFALVFFITVAVSLYVTEPTATNPIPYIDFGGDRAGARLRAVHPDPDAGHGIRRALQPRRDGGAWPALRQISPADAGIYVIAQMGGGVAGALLTKGLLSDEGDGVNYGAVAVSDAHRRRDLPGHGGGVHRHVLPDVGDRRRGGQPAGGQGLGRICDRRGAGPRRDGAGAAHRARASTPLARSAPRWCRASSGAAASSSSSTWSPR